jgi:hypothetical protein
MSTKKYGMTTSICQGYRDEIYYLYGVLKRNWVFIKIENIDIPVSQDMYG